MNGKLQHKHRTQIKSPNSTWLDATRRPIELTHCGPIRFVVYVKSCCQKTRHTRRRLFDVTSRLDNMTGQVVSCQVVYGPNYVFLTKLYRWSAENNQLTSTYMVGIRTLLHTCFPNSMWPAVTPTGPLVNWINPISWLFTTIRDRYHHLISICKSICTAYRPETSLIR